MMRFRSVLLLACLCAAPAIAKDELAEFIAAFTAETQSCKTAPDQEISFEMKTVPGKPVSEPPTPEELAQVKDLLKKADMPYDRVNHKATFDMVLALVRAKQVAAFKVVADPASTAGVKDCLARLASDSGLESIFE